jgi:iron-sulfur cluster repair protein YtfE (RIC family)
LSQQAVVSFVVRFHKKPIEDLIQTSPLYRIKVTHVQQEKEITFEDLEEVFTYMKEQLEQLDNDSSE